MVRLLLNFGAPIDRQDAMFGSSPREWALHGSRYCRDAPNDYDTVLTML
jgi:hypothetical protein